jgi:hypothetical protein
MGGIGSVVTDARSKAEEKWNFDGAVKARISGLDISGLVAAD